MRRRSPADPRLAPSQNAGSKLHKALKPVSKHVELRRAEGSKNASKLVPEHFPGSGKLEKPGFKHRRGLWLHHRRGLNSYKTDLN